MAQPKQVIQDGAIRDAVLARFSKDPGLKTAKIDIEVDKGIVMLKGLVDNKKEMLAAEQVAMGVEAVRGVADSIETRHPRERTEKEIVDDVFRALKSNITVQSDRIRLRVADGKVTLEGIVDSEFQKLMAEAIVKRVRGIRGIANNIEIHAEIVSQEQAAGAEELNGTSEAEALYAEVGTGLDG